MRLVEGNVVRLCVQQITESENLLAFFLHVVVDDDARPGEEDYLAVLSLEAKLEALGDASVLVGQVDAVQQVDAELFGHFVDVQLVDVFNLLRQDFAGEQAQELVILRHDNVNNLYRLSGVAYFDRHLYSLHHLEGLLVVNRNCVLV